jgi:hypothetical protein
MKINLYFSPRFITLFLSADFYRLVLRAVRAATVAETPKATSSPHASRLNAPERGLPFLLKNKI